MKDFEKVTREIMIDHSIVEEQKQFLLKEGKSVQELFEVLVNITDFAVYANSKLEATAEVIAELEPEENPVRDAMREKFSGKPSNLIAAQILLERKRLSEAMNRIEALEELLKEEEA